MKILLRKLSKSLLQRMYIVLVPKPAGPDVGGHDPLERTKEKLVGIHTGGQEPRVITQVPTLQALVEAS